MPNITAQNEINLVLIPQLPLNYITVDGVYACGVSFRDYVYCTANIWSTAFSQITFKIWRAMDVQLSGVYMCGNANSPAVYCMSNFIANSDQTYKGYFKKFQLDGPVACGLHYNNTIECNDQIKTTNNWTYTKDVTNSSLTQIELSGNILCALESNGNIICTDYRSSNWTSLHTKSSYFSIDNNTVYTLQQDSTIQIIKIDDLYVQNSTIQRLYCDTTKNTKAYNAYKKLPILTSIQTNISTFKESASHKTTISLYSIPNTQTALNVITTTSTATNIVKVTRRLIFTSASNENTTTTSLYLPTTTVYSSIVQLESTTTPYVFITSQFMPLEFQFTWFTVVKLCIDLLILLEVVYAILFSRKPNLPPDYNTGF